MGKLSDHASETALKKNVAGMADDVALLRELALRDARARDPSLQFIGGQLYSVPREPSKSSWRDRTILGRPWQDLVFAIGEIVFLIALVPLLFTGARIPLYTGLSTGAMLYLFGICQWSYRNWITLTLTTITATIWVLLGLGVGVTV